MPSGKPPTGKPRGRPFGATSKVASVVRMTVALAARTYSLDAIHYLASVMYSDKERTADRIHASQALLDRAHGKPAQSIEVIDPGTMDQEYMTVDQVREEIRRKGFDRILDLKAKYVGGEYDDSRKPQQLAPPQKVNGKRKTRSSAR